MRKRLSDSNCVKLNWETESFRLTIFPRHPERSHECASWKETLGFEPDSRQERPSDQSVIESGEFEDGWLTLEIKLARIDWRYTVHLKDNVPPSGLPIIGPFQETHNKFLVLMRRWLKSVSPVNRLAFGAVLLAMVDDRSNGYEELDKLLPSVKIDPDGTSDFKYRINRRRFSQLGIKNLQINRLSNWSVIKYSTVLVQLETGRSRVLESGNPLNACRLELAWIIHGAP